MRKVCLSFSGVGESIQDFWFLSKPTDLQHHQGGGALRLLRCHDGVAGIQTETVQDQIQMKRLSVWVCVHVGDKVFIYI